MQKQAIIKIETYKGTIANATPIKIERERTEEVITSQLGTGSATTKTVVAITKIPEIIIELGIPKPTSRRKRSDMWRRSNDGS